jgi:hypothetical protein
MLFFWLGGGIEILRLSRVFEGIQEFASEGTGEVIQDFDGVRA